jgi:hypothetical protein
MPFWEARVRSTPQQALQIFEDLFLQAKRDFESIKSPDERYKEECDNLDALAAVPQAESENEQVYKNRVDVPRLKKKLLGYEFNETYERDKAEHERQLWKTLAALWSRLCVTQDSDWVHHDSAQHEHHRRSIDSTRTSVNLFEMTSEGAGITVSQQIEPSSGPAGEQATSSTQPVATGEVSQNVGVSEMASKKDSGRELFKPHRRVIITLTYLRTTG